MFVGQAITTILVAIAAIPTSYAYKTALYYSQWSYPEHLPSEIPLSHVTNILFAFFDLDTANSNIQLSNFSLVAEERIDYHLTTLQNDYDDLKFHNLSFEANGAMYNELPWVENYLSSAKKFLSADNKNGATSNGLIGQLNRMRALNPRVKISMSIGGAETGKSFRKVTKSKETVLQFVSNVAANIEAFGFDGVDIDWEYPESDVDGERLSYLIQKFHEFFVYRKTQKIITLAIPLDPSVLKYYDFQSMDPYITDYNLMGYDLAGKWSSISGFHSNLYTDKSNMENTLSVDSTVKYLTSMVNSSKILLGMPAYGVSFNTNQLYHKFTKCAALTNNQLYSDLETCVIDYNDLPPEGYIEVSNLETGAGYAYCNISGHEGLITYDTPAVARMKAQYVVDNKLGGGMWWDSQGDTLLSNTKRSLLYNFVDVLGGLSQLGSSNSKEKDKSGVSFPTSVASVKVNSSIFGSNGVKLNASLIYSFWAILSSIFFFF